MIFCFPPLNVFIELPPWPCTPLINLNLSNF